MHWKSSFLFAVISVLLFNNELAAQNTLYFPQFVDGTGLKTSLFFTGLGQATTNVTVELFDQNGSGLTVQTNRGAGSTFAFSLSSNGSTTLRTLGSPGMRVGWARVTSAIAIGVTEVFQLFDANGQVVGEAGVLPANGTAASTLFVSVDGRGENTGVALANVGQSVNPVTLTLYNQNGTAVATSTLSFSPRSQTARFIDQFPGFERINVPFEGTVGISGLGFFSAVGLLFNGLQFSTLPTLPGRIPCPTSNTVDVRGISYLYLAGMPSGTIIDGNTAPLNSPPEAGLCLVPGRELQFSASGSIARGSRSWSPQGENFSDRCSAETNGIGGEYGPAVGLMGVFLGSTQPTPPAPQTVDFSGGVAQLTRFEPALQQPFYIGSGVTSNQIKRFVIPEGATRLFLASAYCGAVSALTGAWSVTTQYAP